MTDLIELLKKASGPDRCLDTAIEAVLDGKPIPVLKVEVLPGVWEDRLNAIFSYTAPNYTASIDAALTLVPEHSAIRIANMHEGVVGGHAWIDTLKSPVMSFFEIHGVFNSTPDNRKSMAIALCIAALKAREALAKATNQ